MFAIAQRAISKRSCDEHTTVDVRAVTKAGLLDEPEEGHLVAEETERSRFLRSHGVNTLGPMLDHRRHLAAHTLQHHAEPQLVTAVLKRKRWAE